jgi:hypothetical protein
MRFMSAGDIKPEAHDDPPTDFQRATSPKSGML